MDFEIPFETKQLVDSLRKFLKQEIEPLAEKYKFTDNIPYEVHLSVRKRSREVGFYGIHMPVDVGGGGISTFTFCVLLEELGRNNVEQFATDIIGGAGGPSMILTDCDEEQKKKYLSPLMNVEKTCCFALTEPWAGSDATAIRTTARREGDYYILNGRKHYITNAPYADFAIVFAVTDKEKGAKGGITCFLVDRDTPGYSVGQIHQTMSGSGMHGELLFEDCKVPKENILGKEGMGFIQAMKWIGIGRLMVAAECIGCAERVLSMAINYAKQRVAFGQPIAKYQAIQWMIADSATEIYAAKMMLYNAAWLADSGKNIRKEASMAKLYASEMAGRVIDRALQIHGGAGFMKDLPIERLYRTIRAARIGEGTSEIQRLTIAKELMKEY